MPFDEVDHEDFLTDEEREAYEDLASDTESEPESESEQEPEPEEEEEEEPEKKEEPEPEPEKKEEQEPEPKEEEEEEPEKKEEPEPEPEPEKKEEAGQSEISHKFKASDTYDDDLRAQLDDLKKKRDDGSIDFDDYQDSRDRIVREQTARDFDRNEHERDALKVEKEFFNKNPEYRPDNKIRFNALNNEVIELQGDSSWANRPYPELLGEAKARVEKAFGIVKPEKAPDNKEGKNNRPKQKVEPPPSSGDLPASDDVEIAGDEFAELDAMNPIDLEGALARMSPDRREAYLAR